MSDDREQIDTNIQVMLARIDERTRSTDKEIAELRKEFLLYVTKVEFNPVKMLVFGITGLILSSAIVVILSRTIGL